MFRLNPVYRRLSTDDDPETGRSLVADEKPDPRGSTLERGPSRRLLVIVIFVQALALIWVLYDKGPKATKYPAPNLVYSPAQDAVKYRITKFSIGGDRKFHIPPSDELDDAWNDLYNFGISRIPKSQAALLPNKTQPIPGDEGYYIVELDVFHNLHCLNMIRKTLHSDYYTHMAMNLNDNAQHMDHCVDWLRQSLMCAGDTSVIVWQWDEEEQKNKFQGDIAHTCRNFEKLQEWGNEHRMIEKYDATIRLEDDIVIPVIYS